MNNQDKTPYIMLCVLGVVVVLIFWTISAMISQHISSDRSEDTVEKFTVEKSEEPYREKTPETVAGDDGIKLVINPLEEYNYMSKKDIYRIRKKYVNTSIFANDNYKPNEEVFGQIEDGKLWWGMNQYICNRGSDNASGISAMSRFINNPNILIAAMYPFVYDYNPQTELYCNSDFARLVPYEMSYDKNNKLITAKYKLGQIAIENKHKMTLVGMNARDFGYEYVFVDKITNINMLEQVNAHNEIYRLRDFVHKGGSCRMEGGCNNISPYQRELNYSLTDFPAEMSIKLWKNKPLSNMVGGEMNYKIIFEGI